MQLASKVAGFGQVTGDVERLNPESAASRLVESPDALQPLDAPDRNRVSADTRLSSTPSNEHSEEQAAFPTDAKVKEKARRKGGKGARN